MNKTLIFAKGTNVFQSKDVLQCKRFGSSDGKKSACKAGDPGLISESGRSPGEGKGNPFQYSFLENPMDRGAW